MHARVNDLPDFILYFILFFVVCINMYFCTCYLFFHIFWNKTVSL